MKFFKLFCGLLLGVSALSLTGCKIKIDNPTGGVTETPNTNNNNNNNNGNNNGNNTGNDGPVIEKGETVTVEFIFDGSDKLEATVTLQPGTETINPYDTVFTEQLVSKLESKGYSLTLMYYDEAKTEKIATNEVIEIKTLKNNKLTVYCELKPSNEYWDEKVKTKFNSFNYEQSFTFSRIVDGRETVWIDYNHETKVATGEFFYDFVPEEEMFDESGNLWWTYNYSWNTTTGVITYRRAVFSDFLVQGDACGETFTSEGTVTWEDVKRCVDSNMEKESLNAKTLYFETKKWTSVDDFICYNVEETVLEVKDFTKLKTTFVVTKKNSDYSYKLVF